MGDLATTLILPCSNKIPECIIENIKGLKEAGLPETTYANQKHILKQISEHINVISEHV